MGTLFEQPVREQYRNYDKEVSNFIDSVKEFSSKHQISISDTIKCIEVLELRRKNNLYAANGDIHDEQMKGFGEILDKISESILRIADNT